MADTLYLKDGRMVVLHNEDDFLKLLYQEMGRDVEQKMMEILDNRDFKIQEQDARIQELEDE